MLGLGSCLCLASLAMAVEIYPVPMDAFTEDTEGCRAAAAALNLFQTDVFLQKNQEAVPSAVHSAHAHAEEVSAHRFKEAKKSSKAAALAPVIQANAAAISQQQEADKSHDFDFRSIFNPTSLLQQSESEAMHQEARLMERYVNGMNLKDGAMPFVIIGALAMICLCVFMSTIYGTIDTKSLEPEGRLGLGGSGVGLGLGFGGASSGASSAPTGAAHQLLQASRSTNPAQTPMMASLAPKRSQGNAAGPSNLPPICPSLILPHTEARFMIPLENLIRGQGELEIRGTSGRKLLHGAISETPEGARCLALASCGCEEDPRVTVLSPPRDYEGSTPRDVLPTLQIYGKGGKFYGTLEQVPNGGALLRCDGEVVMSLELAGKDMRMTASAMDGRLLASAGKNVQVSVRQDDHNSWKLQVKPGCDAVLIASCMLGVLLFGNGLGH